MKLIHTGNIELTGDCIGIGEISYDRVKTKQGTYSIYLGTGLLIAIPIGINPKDIGQFRKTPFFVSSDFANFSFFDPNRIKMPSGSLPIEGPPQYTLDDDITEPPSVRNLLFESNYDLETPDHHHYHSVKHERDMYTEIYMDGKLWMIYADNRSGDGGLPIYRATTPIKGAYAFLILA